MFEAGVLNGLTRISVELGSSKSRSDDDFVDRVNHSYTTTVLMLCTLIVLGRQFIGKPMSCWTPNEFTGAQVEYATLVCWVTSTYFIAPNQATIPSDLTVRRKDSIHYYQWVPFILMFQAAMFSVPCIIWRLFNWQSRIHLWTIMELANKAGDVKEMTDLRSNHLNFVVRHLEDALAMRHLRRRRRKNLGSMSTYYQKITSPSSTKNSPDLKETPWYATIPLTVTYRSRVPGPRPCYPHSSSYLIGLYLIVKVLYIFNSTGQLFLTARFLGQPTIFYGAHMLFDLMHGEQWESTGNFPRVTFCDFDMRRMGSNYHRYTLQCVIGINMFNEKIFIFLWFWLMILTCMNINSFLRWCCRSTFESSRVSFIQTLLLERNALSTTTSTGTSCSSSSTYKAINSGEDTSLGQQYPFGTGALLIERLTEADKKSTTFFTEQVLGQDGVFVLRLVTLNAGRSVAAHITEQVWNRYKQATEPKQTSTERRPHLPRLVLPPLPTRSFTKQKSTDDRESGNSGTPSVPTPLIARPSSSTIPFDQPQERQIRIPLTTFGIVTGARKRSTLEERKSPPRSSNNTSSTSTEHSIKSEIKVVSYSDGLV